MATSLDLDQHLDALGSSATRIAELARTGGLERAVPTCPTWDVGDLVAHLAMVHRWATAQVIGDDPADVPSPTTLRALDDGLPAVFDEGWRRLVDALHAAPADLQAMTFLNDAPAPREFWARRQAHETTVHMVDALAAHLGRPPSAAEAALAAPLALDGVDELLRGFFTRGRSELAPDPAAVDAPYTVAVDAVDGDRSWTLRITDVLTVEPAGTPVDDPDVRVRGTASDLYRWLWNRGGDVEVIGDAAFVDRWRAGQRVRWR